MDLDGDCKLEMDRQRSLVGHCEPPHPHGGAATLTPAEWASGLIPPDRE